MSARRQEIEKKATEILDLQGLGTGPIDPIQVANGLGLKVFNATFSGEGIHGLIARRGADTTIYVNANDSPSRKRFTVAHEVGHFVLHLAAGEGQFIDDEDNFRTTADPDKPWNEERTKEWAANVFASALLMPEKPVRQQWSQLKDIEGLASWFQVSPQAMTFRLETLGLLK